jgi:serine/threonine-protein kinase
VVLAHLLLGQNIFKGPTSEESRRLIMNRAIPDFRQLDERISERLNEILHRALARDLAKRYASADEMLYDLEHYIYHSGYGPTNETMGRLIREVFGTDPARASADAKGSTQIIERAARSTRHHPAA